MGFFDFIKKKKAEEHEVPQVLVRSPEYSEAVKPVTPSQLFDEEPAEHSLQASHAMRQTEEEDGTPAPEARQSVSSVEEEDETEVYVEPVGGELAQELSEEAEFLPEPGEDNEDADTEEDAVLSEDRLIEAEGESVAEEEDMLLESELSEQESLIQEMEDSGSILLGGERDVLVNLEEEPEPPGETVERQPEEEPDGTIEEEAPEAAAAYAEENRKKKFLFFGGKREEQPLSAAGHTEAEPKYTGDNKSIRELHRSVKDLREERSSFANKFERTYAEQNKQINNSFNGLRGEIRQDINGIGKEFVAANNKANGQISKDIKDQSAAIGALEHTVTEESGKIRSELQMGFARNKVALTDVTHTVEQLSQTQTENLERVDEALMQVHHSIAGQSEKSEQNKDEIVDRIERNTAAILQRLTDGADKDVELDAMTPSQHYKNMRYSVVSLMLSVFAAFLLLTSCLQVLKLVAPGGSLNPIVILDFLLVYIVAAAGIVLAMFQKKFFFAKGIKTLKAYFKSKNPAHSVSKLSMLVSFITLIINTILMFTAIIVIIVVAVT